MKIKKKIWPEYFEHILAGRKKFELRLADFECNPGDTLLLEEWDPQTKKYTGRTIEKNVTYIFKTKDATKFWPQEKIDECGFQIISFD